MYVLTVASLLLMAASSNAGYEFSWLQGSWQSDRARTIAANPDVRKLPSEVQLKFASILGSTIWKIEGARISISHPESGETLSDTYTVHPIGPDRFHLDMANEDGTFVLVRTDFGFCTEWQLYEMTSSLTECFSRKDD